MAVRRSVMGDGRDDFNPDDDDMGGFDGGLIGHDMDRGVNNDDGMVMKDAGDSGIAPSLGDDISHDEGNSTSAREMFDRRPTTDGLPRGMTVQQDQGYAPNMGDSGGYEPNSMSTPTMSMEPNPVSGMTANPATSTPETTRRVSSMGSTSALFGQQAGTPLFGRAGGLMGGGTGVQASSEGAPTPTQMMLSLLRMFRNGV